MTTGGTSPVSYTGLSISNLSAQPGRDHRPGREGDRVNVQVNMVADPAVLPPAVADRLDWAAYTPAERRASTSRRWAGSATTSACTRTGT